MSYLINERLTKQRMREELKELNKQYAGRRYEHTNGDTYEIYAATTMNDNGQSEWGFIYSPVDNDGYTDRTILHTRSLREFLDGRFTMVEG